MSLSYIAIDTARAQGLRMNAADANGQSPEITLSDGNANPCRHCLAEIPRQKPMLILAHRPFEHLHAYAETGPIFLCAEDCNRYPADAGLPPLYRGRNMLIRGYDSGERIIYGTGKVIEMASLESEADRLFADPLVAFIHLRSATNNCYHFRIERQPRRNAPGYPVIMPGR